jgi:hypothetical protein
MKYFFLKLISPRPDFMWTMTDAGRAIMQSIRNTGEASLKNAGRLPIARSLRPQADSASASSMKSIRCPRS